MDPEAAKYIGAGIACLGMAGAGIGLGHISRSVLKPHLRLRRDRGPRHLLIRRCPHPNVRSLRTNSNLRYNDA